MGLFSDLISMLEQIAKDVAGLAKIPMKERKEVLELLDQTYSLLDQANLLVMIRLNDVLLEGRTDQEKLGNELRRLANDKEWLKIERDVRLCSSLSQASIEWKRWSKRLPQEIALSDRGGFRFLVDDILEGERALADFIGKTLETLSGMADEAEESVDKQAEALDAVRAMRDVLRGERRRLIEAQIASYALI